MKFIHNKFFKLRSIAGKKILVPTGIQRKSNTVYLLNETAAYIWTLLSEGKMSAEELAIKIASVYNIDYNIALHDVEAILNKLKEYGAIMYEQD